MTDESKIINGSYKDVPLRISEASVTGGRKVAIKQFPSRDTQSVEDLGKIPRRHSLQIIISDRQNEDYFAYRDRLLRVLESKGPGLLEHPLFGRIENVVVATFSLVENYNSFGDATISVNFETTENTGIPKSSDNVISQIVTANQVVQDGVDANIAKFFQVNNKFTGNFTAAVSKVTAIVDAVEGVVAFTGEVADTLNEFNSEISQLRTDIQSLVSNPKKLASSITNLFSGVDGLFSAPQTTFDSFLGIFGFGIGDTETQTSTAGLAERKRNDDILNSAVNAAILGYAYLANSDDTRNSPTQGLLKALGDKSKNVIVHDPYVKEYKGELDEVLKGADAIIFMVAHDQYKKLNLNKLKKLMLTFIISDGSNIIDKGKANKQGFTYKGVGNV